MSVVVEGTRSSPSSKLLCEMQSQKTSDDDHFLHPPRAAHRSGFWYRPKQKRRRRNGSNLVCIGCTVSLSNYLLNIDTIKNTFLFFLQRKTSVLTDGFMTLMFSIVQNMCRLRSCGDLDYMIS